jgi:hypothetical protein
MKSTIYLHNRITNEDVAAEIIIISVTDLKKITKSAQFGFNWLKETHNPIYGLRLIDNKEVVGLMSLKDNPKELSLEIVLLESSKSNLGKDKVLDRIAGCLIAYACDEAFTKRYEGFVCLTPKTILFQYYQEKYGFRQFGRQLATMPDNSTKLIFKYL